MNTSSDLHTRLKNARIQKGYSQNDIAEKLNISRQAVSRWENGHAYPDIDNLALLSEIYGISVDELLGKEVTETTNNIELEPETENDTEATAKTNNSKATDTPKTDSSTNKLTSYFDREDLFLILILLLSSIHSIIGVVVSGYILIWTILKKRTHIFLLFLSIVCFLCHLNNTLFIISMYIPELSSGSIIKVS